MVFSDTDGTEFEASTRIAMVYETCTSMTTSYLYPDRALCLGQA